MSLDKAHHEATRWLQTAFEDLEAAQVECTPPVRQMRLG